MVVLVELCCFFDISSSFMLMKTAEYPMHNTLTYVFTWAYYGAQLFAPALMAFYFYLYIHHDVLSGRVKSLLSIPLIIGETIVLLNPFTGFAFTITNGIFERGPLLIVLYMTLAAYMIISLVIVARDWKNVDQGLRLVLVSFLLINISSAIIQYLAPSYLVECSGMTILILITHYSVQNKVMLEEAVNKEREIAVIAERMNNLKSKFISEMSHDIRTPMNAIIGMSNIAKEEIENREQAINALDIVLTSAQHLMALINNIIEMNDLNNDSVDIETKPVIFENEINAVAAMMRPQFEEKEQVLQVRYSGTEECYVMADILRIDQVLIKIISNASTYMESGKKAIIEVSFSELDNGFIQYVIDVVDEGKGMSPDYVEHMFEPFEKEITSTESGNFGSGLSLAIVKRLLDAMNADVDVESVPGKGTRFSLRFSFERGDRIVRQTKEDVVEKKEDESMSMKGILSLVVEDNEVNVRILSRALRRNGSAVIIAKNGQEAVDKVEKIGLDRIGVIFMDLQMPVMDGFEATRQIRAIEKDKNVHIPIYAVTANTATEDCTEAFNSGVDGIFAKPVHFEEFFDTLANDGIIRKA